jgi:hypothetical protein
MMDKSAAAPTRRDVLLTATGVGITSLLPHCFHHRPPTAPSAVFPLLLRPGQTTGARAGLRRRTVRKYTSMTEARDVRSFSATDGRFAADAFEASRGYVPFARCHIAISTRPDDLSGAARSATIASREDIQLDRRTWCYSNVTLLYLHFRTGRSRSSGHTRSHVDSAYASCDRCCSDHPVMRSEPPP